eukprot:TRINITY_DN38095_c0_g1_i1.p1 TRINITY_DN38095_c0_g1~~TRINITY_DN38095_c0_g1_i1.p1  ORF type:complete len:228 (+),score=32.09 TRINITY_DN38095_c0_g1_i1:72-755(+)
MDWGPFEYVVHDKATSSVVPVTRNLADECDLIALVFAAHWCPPARNFCVDTLADARAVIKDGLKIPLPSSVMNPAVVPAETSGKANPKGLSQGAQRGGKNTLAAKRERELAERMAAFQKQEEELLLPQRRFECVLVSHDRDAAAFERLLQVFPGVAVPFRHPMAARLFTGFDVSGLPMVIVLEPHTGRVVQRDAALTITRGVERSYRDLWGEWRPEDAEPPPPPVGA